MVTERQMKLQRNIEFRPFNSQITYTYHVHAYQWSKHVENGSPGAHFSFRLDYNIKPSVSAISIVMIDLFNTLVRQNREVWLIRHPFPTGLDEQWFANFASSLAFCKDYNSKHIKHRQYHTCTLYHLFVMHRCRQKNLSYMYFAKFPTKTR